MADLGALYRAHGPLARAVAFRILGDARDAEDVVQETFLELWRRTCDVPVDGAARSLIFLIARCRALDRLRAEKAHGRALERAERAALRFDTGAANDGERCLTVRRILAMIPARQRQPIELSYVHGLTHPEIAARTGVPLGTVKTRIRLGVKRLAVLLAVAGREKA